MGDLDGEGTIVGATVGAGDGCSGGDAAGALVGNSVGAAVDTAVGANVTHAFDSQGPQTQSSSSTHISPITQP